MQYLSRIRILLLWLTSVAVALVSYRFLALGLETAFPGMLGHIAERKLIFILHISAAPLVLVLGLFQFLPRLRAKRPAVHRWGGRLYGGGVLVGGLAGLFWRLGLLIGPLRRWGLARWRCSGLG